MAQNNTIYEVVLDENGIAILKQVRDITAKIEQNDLQLYELEYFTGAQVTLLKQEVETSVIPFIKPIWDDVELLLLLVNDLIKDKNKDDTNKDISDVLKTFYKEEGTFLTKAGGDAARGFTEGELPGMIIGAATGLGFSVLTNNDKTLKNQLLKDYNGNFIIGSDMLATHHDQNMEVLPDGESHFVSVKSTLVNNLTPKVPYRTDLLNGLSLYKDEEEDIDQFLHLNLEGRKYTDKEIFNKSLSKWLGQHVNEQIMEMQQYATLAEIDALNKRVHEFGYSTIEDAFKDTEHPVFSYYSQSPHQRNVSEKEKQFIIRENADRENRPEQVMQKAMASYMPELSSFSSDSLPYELNTFSSHNRGSSSPGDIRLDSLHTNALYANSFYLPESHIGGASAVGTAGNKGGGGNTFHMNTNFNTTHNNQSSSAKDIHDAVVSVLTSAVADAKIGTDIH